jgi:hypothetical protein
MSCAFFVFLFPWNTIRRVRFQPVYSVQFSMLRSWTRPNSPVLLVTSVSSKERACAAMTRSSAPIIVPRGGACLGLVGPGKSRRSNSKVARQAAAVGAQRNHFGAFALADVNGSRDQRSDGLRLISFSSLLPNAGRRSTPRPTHPLSCLVSLEKISEYYGRWGICLTAPMPTT